MRSSFRHPTTVRTSLKRTCVLFSRAGDHLSSARETVPTEAIVRFGIRRYTRLRTMNDGLTDDPPVEDERSQRRIFRRLDTRGREIDWRRNLWAIWLAEMLAILGFSLRTHFLTFYLQDLCADSDCAAKILQIEGE